MDDTIRTTEDFIEELRAVAVVDIRMSDNGLEFLNSDQQILFTIPFAKGGD